MSTTDDTNAARRGSGSNDQLGAWQPIATAPMTGKKVILFYMNRNAKARTVMARWLTDEQAAETDADGADLLQEPVAENLERCAACGEVFDIEDHAPEDDDYDDYEPPPPPRSSTGHEWDDDAVCIHCGFDGAEWHHWKHHTYEGKAQPEAKPPLCTRRA